MTAVRLEGGRPLFSLASVLGLLVAGTTGRRFVVAGVGIAGVLVLPWVVGYFFGGTVGTRSDPALRVPLILNLLRRRRAHPRI